MNKIYTFLFEEKNVAHPSPEERPERPPTYATIIGRGQPTRPEPRLTPARAVVASPASLRPLSEKATTMRLAMGSSRRGPAEEEARFAPNSRTGLSFSTGWSKKAALFRQFLMKAFGKNNMDPEALRLYNRGYLKQIKRTGGGHPQGDFTSQNLTEETSFLGAFFYPRTNLEVRFTKNSALGRLYFGARCL